MAPRLASGKAMRRQSGFAYLLALLLVVLMGLGLGAAGTLWHTESQRLKESELLYIGEQYRQAISSYYNAPGPIKRYPKSLDELLLDTRQPTLTRHLRKLYADPLTGKKEWGLIIDPDAQQIRGVYSLAPGQPFKQTGFDAQQKEFENAQSYAAWRFIVTTAVPAPPIPSQSAPKQPPLPK